MPEPTPLNEPIEEVKPEGEDDADKSGSEKNGVVDGLRANEVG